MIGSLICIVPWGTISHSRKEVKEIMKRIVDSKDDEDHRTGDAQVLIDYFQKLEETRVGTVEVNIHHTSEVQERGEEDH